MPVLEPHTPIVILGAGPAGLTAAYESTKRNLHPILIEKSSQVGGMARTELYRGYRFDIGGHRFFTHFDEIRQIWHELLGSDFVKVPRVSRIYYQKHFYQYPLSLYNAISNLGVWEGLLILLSYMRARMRSNPEDDNLEQWVTNRFGKRLYETFFKTYTEKVWGIPCHAIQADWAAQRISGLSLRRILHDAIFRGNNDSAKSLIREFHYPVAGPGMMWERMQERIEQQGGTVILKAESIRIQCKDNRVHVVLTQQNGKEIRIKGESVISSIPLDELIFQIDPPPPEEVLAAARQLVHRAFIIVGLILDRSRLFPDNWIYIHSPEVMVGRIQNFKNWSPDMVPDESKSSLGMEYFCSEGDELWKTPDEALIQLAKNELRKLGLADSSSVQDAVVFRQSKAYPVYSYNYRRHIQKIRRFLDAIPNLQTIGRNGLHRYNNQDHSMLTAKMAVGNLFDEKNDIWSANTEPTYYE